MRPYTSPNPPPVKNQSYKFAVGTTKILKEGVVRKFAADGKAVVVVSEVAAPSAMELD
jgi:transketolase C-terminal domain/subunit